MKTGIETQHIEWIPVIETFTESLITFETVFVKADFLLLFKGTAHLKRFREPAVPPLDSS